MNDEVAQRIANRVNRNQRLTILDLDSEKFYILGCAEPVAARLCKGTPNRPPLVEKRHDGDAPSFRLTPLGVEVRAKLQAMKP